MTAWRYDQSSGDLRDPSGHFVCRGYSGHGAGKNNPARQHERAVGPIPRGRWKIGAPYDSKNVGPYALTLTPCAGTEVFGRSAFRIHGDSKRAPGTASHGCIILPRPVRERIWASGVHEIEVVE